MISLLWLIYSSFWLKHLLFHSVFFLEQRDNVILRCFFQLLFSKLVVQTLFANITTPRLLNYVSTSFSDLETEVKTKTNSICHFVFLLSGSKC